MIKSRNFHFGDNWLAWYALALSLVILIPIAVVVASSFSGSGFLVFPPQTFSLKWYGSMLSSWVWRGSFWVSVELGLLVAAISLTIGVPTALGIHRLPGAQRTIFETLFLTPLMLPTIVLGFSLLQIYQSVHVGNSLVTLALGQSVIGIPYVIRLTLASLSSLDENAIKAARSLGANRWTVFRRIIFPLARGGIVAGGLFSFIISLDDVNIALFLSGIDFTPLPVRLFSYIMQNSNPLGAAVASILVLLAVLLMFITDRMVGIEWVFGLKGRRRRNM